MPTRRCILLSLAAVAAGASAADDYPSRPIRIIVPYPAGGSQDIAARAIGNKLAQNLGQPVIVDNRVGASGLIGLDALARARPDGYTVGFSVPGSLTVAAALGRKLPYDPVKDFTPISVLVKNPLAIVADSRLPITSLKDLIDFAKRHPGQLFYGTSGAGTSQHLIAEMLNQVAGINMVHVPFNGPGAVVQSLLGGQIQLAFVVVPSVLTQVKAGKINVLTVIEDHRLPELPNVPTNREALAGFEPQGSWVGVFAPANLTPVLAKRLNEEFVKALRDPGVESYLRNNSMVTVGSTSEQFSAQMKKETLAWTEVVKSRRIAVDQ